VGACFGTKEGRVSAVVIVAFSAELGWSVEEVMGVVCVRRNRSSWHCRIVGPSWLGDEQVCFGDCGWWGRWSPWQDERCALSGGDGEKGSVRLAITCSWADCDWTTSSRSFCRAAIDMKAGCVVASWKPVATSLSESKAASAAARATGQSARNDFASVVLAIWSPFKMIQVGES